MIRARLARSAVVVIRARTEECTDCNSARTAIGGSTIAFWRECECSDVVCPLYLIPARAVSGVAMSSQVVGSL